MVVPTHLDFQFKLSRLCHHGNAANRPNNAQEDSCSAQEDSYSAQEDSYIGFQMTELLVE